MAWIWFKFKKGKEEEKKKKDVFACAQLNDSLQLG